MELKKPGDKHLQKKKAETAEKDISLVAEGKAKPAKATKNPFKGKYRLPLIIALSILGVAIITCGVFLIICRFSSNQDKLHSDLERLGQDFYETYYYEQLKGAYEEDKLKDFLSKYSSTGIKINLDNLKRYPSEQLDNAAITDEFKNNKTGEACDSTATKITIYPTEPYGATDYRLESTLSCGFAE